MTSSLKFGTSGLRGLAVDLQGDAARAYVAAFLAHLRSGDRLSSRLVFLARDLRASSAAIAADCAAAIAGAGCEPVDCGLVPTPALALHAMAGKGAAIMITGSHIPADRNGLKFYTPTGEITKADEAGIASALASAMPCVVPLTVRDESAAAQQRYLDRYRGLLPPGSLGGWRIGVFEHSSVARDLLGELLRSAGASVVSLGRVDQFVAVDTEAFADRVLAPLPNWVVEHQLDAIVSADGDGDRPLLMDANGSFVRGDALGLMAAQFLKADMVVTPVTSNSAIERTGGFARVVRTKVGSPFVIAGLEQAIADGGERVVGFEANGGTLVASELGRSGFGLTHLPTRDAVLPLLAAFALAANTGRSIAQIVAALSLRPAFADRIERVEVESVAAFLGDLRNRAFSAEYFAERGAIAGLSQTDGLQFTLANGDQVHYRGSGNAPELRCYIEASSIAAADALLKWGLAAATRRLNQGT